MQTSTHTHHTNLGGPRWAALSPRTLRAMTIFGVSPDEHAPARQNADDAARRVCAFIRDRAERPGPHAPGASIVLIRGASGAGKSTLLNAVCRLAAREGACVHRAEPEAQAARSTRRRVLDLFSGAPGDDRVVLERLATVGLADARAILRFPHELSTGQRARLALALALERCQSRPGQAALVACDEFASGLDPITALALASTLSKWRGRAPANITLLLASSHAAPGSELQRLLSPDLLVSISCDGVPAFRESHAPRAPRPRVVVGPGCTADYLRLAPLHYRGGRPATIVRVLTARIARMPEPAGVLVVSMPTLNGRWRELVWPGRYTSCPRAVGIRRLNDEVRCISRVIVDPRVRGVGVATRLIRAYLGEPLTPATEAVAAIASMCPIFEHAGMTRYDLTPTRRDARLHDALAERALRAEDLGDPPRAAAALLDPLIARELRRWAGASRATCARKDADLSVIARAAWASLGSPGIAFAHTRR